ncbi:MAG TPA: hypothetical protein VL086_04770 [Candidatus Nitrosotalea sp.]|jgi:hypothetical protein|nr:hypothetical protein [Candidatus Nitrosotalea sp.]
MATSAQIQERGADRARHDRDVEPCPPEKREAIEEALRHFGMI